MKNIIWFVFIIGMSTLLITACAPNVTTPDGQPNVEENPKVNEENEGDESQNNQANQEEDESDLPQLEATKTVKIMIEGMEEERTVHLFQSQTLGFSTYVPGHMILEDTEEALIAYGKNTDGSKNENALFKISKAKVNSEAQLKEEMKNKGFDVTLQEHVRHDISQVEYVLGKGETVDSIVGVASLFEHNDQIYTLIYYYPIEYGDGFEPTVKLILDEIVWH